MQNVEINALNKVGVIGAGFVPPSLHINQFQTVDINNTGANSNINVSLSESSTNVKH